MKYFILGILYLFPFSSIKSQVGIGKNYDCVQVSKLTFKQRLSNYPFDKSNKILLLSFPSEILNFPLQKGFIDWKKVKDSITLNNNQIDSLTNIVFNFGCRADKVTKNVSTAVGVNIAVVFIGSTNKPIDYIEVCFECMEIDLFLANRKTPIGTPCNQRFDILKAFAKTCGLRL